MDWKRLTSALCFYVSLAWCQDQIQAHEYILDLGKDEIRGVAFHRRDMITCSKNMLYWDMENETSEAINPDGTFMSIQQTSDERYVVGASNTLFAFNSTSRSLEPIFTVAPGDPTCDFVAIAIESDTLSLISLSAYSTNFIEICVYDWNGDNYTMRICHPVNGQRPIYRGSPFAHSFKSGITIVQTGDNTINFVNITDGSIVTDANPEASTGYQQFTVVTINGTEYFAASQFAQDNLFLYNTHNPADKSVISNFGAAILVVTSDPTIWWSASSLEVVKWKVVSRFQLDPILKIPWTPATVRLSAIVMSQETSLPMVYTYLQWPRLNIFSSVPSETVDTTPTIPLPPSQEEVQTSQSKLSLGTGAIIGIVIGGVCALAIVTVGIFILKRKSKSQDHVFSGRTSRYASTRYDIPLEISIHDSTNWNIPYSRLQIGKKLGEGGFGIVFLAELDGVTCVVKQMKSSSNPDDQKKAQDDFVKEMDAMRKLRKHPNVCKLFGVCTNPSNPFCIITEYMSEGSLWDFLTKGNIKLTKEMTTTFCKDTASGMTHLHQVDERDDYHLLQRHC
eukprot:TRINITY_DN3068_c0_g2_i4.p1 TRINITY_DN3068_c0_g2~~TRINITY_DN3068_c0_g2_i4.p1  ORF type:complete len:563 (-),score=126.07 TRINITY_DN3068_c0_g2_i4:24-1712(-)